MVAVDAAARGCARPPEESKVASCKPNSASRLPKAASPPVVAEAADADGFGTARGTLVEPGTYTVTVALAGKTDSKTVVVEQDPRIQVPTTDREKRRQTIDTLITLTREADAARKKAVAIHTALTI